MALELIVKEVHPDYYQIDELPAWQNTWWTARRLGHGWYITNKRGTVLKETSVQGRRILKAIEAYQHSEAPHVL